MRSRDMIKIIMLPSPFDKMSKTALTTFDLPKGALAFRQDDTARGPYYVASGEIELIRHTQSGNLVILHRAQAGETFSEPCLFSDTYHCDCKVLADCQLIRIDKAALLAQLQSDSDFAMQLLGHFAGQVQSYRRHQELLAIRGATDRVLAALSVTGQCGSVMAFAASIGLTHEATYRALSSLTKSGEVEKIARGQYQLRAISS